MDCNILAVGIWDSFLSNLAPVMQKQGGSIFSVSDFSTIGPLLTKNHYSLLLTDLSCFIGCTYPFILDVGHRSLPIVILGTAGVTYSWPVEQAADRFYSYGIPARQLVEQIETLVRWN